ncbi:methylenetetrahydrofolate reductase C-terminal domain-containing protein [candidate division KSB1 bacterium]|nr:methylenetetrahydrofolate reductase C-terminal domain-containing protein [candidate division KSB1 bacterium]
MPVEFITQHKKPISPTERKFSFLFRLAEDAFKVPVFRCKHCGECILSSTGFTCSQRCPKRLRNGPCGGTGENGTCEVYPDRKCIWYLIHKRSKLTRRLSMLYSIKKIHNWQLEGTSAWLNVFLRRIDPPAFFPPKKKATDTDDT